MFWCLYYNLYYVVFYTIIIQYKHCYLVIFYNKKKIFGRREEDIHNSVLEGMGERLV